MQLCILSGRRFEDTFEDAQWRKTHKCYQCDYASSQAGNLKTHLKTHSGEKTNKCNQCDFASVQASSLKKHLRTHSGEKSNECGVCEKGFRRNNEMMKYKKKQHLGVDVRNLFIVLTGRQISEKNQSYEITKELTLLVEKYMLVMCVTNLSVSQVD